MNILIDLWHPAHYHLLKDAAGRLRKMGDRVFWVIKPKDVLIELLNHDGVFFKVASKTKGYGGISLASQFLRHTWHVYRFSKKFNADLLMGTSASIGWAGKMSGVKSIVLNEDDAKAVPRFAKLAYPPATRVLKPDCLSYETGINDIYHQSYHELAYLHPDIFFPKAEIPKKYGLEPYRYSILRLSALQAHHDLNAAGISPESLMQIREMLKPHGAVVESFENREEKTFRVSPADMHDILAFAKILISDSQTMTAEAAVLGIPSVRCNTFVGRLSYLEELEKRFFLTFGYRPDDGDRLINKIRELLSFPVLLEEWKRRRQTMLDAKVNLTAWLIDFIEDLRKEGDGL